MKRLVLLFPLLMLTGCWQFVGSTDIQCWFISSYVPGNVDHPWYLLHGRTDKWHSDERGAEFTNKTDLDAYISQHNLKMCGTN